LLAEGLRMEQAGVMPGQAAVPSVTKGSQTGVAAVAWKESLVWKMRDGTLAIVGETTVAFESDDKPATTVTRLFADRLEAVLTSMSLTPESGGTSPQQAMQIRSASAVGNVAVRGSGLSFDAGKLEFDASSNLATASGQDGRSVEVFTEDGKSSARFNGLRWDVATGQVKDLRGIDVRARP